VAKSAVNSAPAPMDTLFIDRTARAMARRQSHGPVRGDLAPEPAARAMVDHTLYLWSIQGEYADEQAVLDTLDRVCVGAPGLDRRH